MAVGPQSTIFYFSTALMQGLRQSHSYLCFSFEGFARFSTQVWIHLRRKDCSAVQHYLGMGCSTILQAAKPTTPPSYPPPEAASHIRRQMWRCATSLAPRSGSSWGTLLWWCPVSEGFPRAVGCICPVHRAVLMQTHHQEKTSAEHQQQSLHLSAAIQVNISWCNVQARY